MESEKVRQIAWLGRKRVKALSSVPAVVPIVVVVSFVLEIVMKVAEKTASHARLVNPPVVAAYIVGRIVAVDY